MKRDAIETLVFLFILILFLFVELYPWTSKTC